MADKENKAPEAGQKLAGKPGRRLRPKGYYYGPVGFSMLLCPLGTPTRLKASLPEDPEKLRKKCKSAEDVFVFTAKPKQKPKNTRKPDCTLMWGDDEDAEPQCVDGEQGIKRDLQKPPGFAEIDDGAEQQMLAEAPDEGFESDKENQVNLESLFQAQTQEGPEHDGDDDDEGLECDCGYWAHRKALKAAGCIPSRENTS
ncbi:uncharacterized protein LOC140707509 [Pogona vitticeps]